MVRAQADCASWFARQNRGDTDMFNPFASSHKCRQGLALACIIAGTTIASTAAFAGECPADKMKANVRAMVDAKAVGVTDVTLGAINLEKQPAHIEGREL